MNYPGFKKVTYEEAFKVLTEKGLAFIEKTDEKSLRGMSLLDGQLYTFGKKGNPIKLPTGLAQLSGSKWYLNKKLEEQRNGK